MGFGREGGLGEVRGERRGRVEGDAGKERRGRENGVRGLARRPEKQRSQQKVNEPNRAERNDTVKRGTLKAERRGEEGEENERETVRGSSKHMYKRGGHSVTPSIARSNSLHPDRAIGIDRRKTQHSCS